MGNRNLHRLESYTRKHVVMAGSITIGAAGVVSSVSGYGFSAARTAAGLYTVTLADAYNELVSCQLTMQATVASDIVAQVVASSIDTASGGTVDLRTHAAAIDTDPDATDVIHFVLHMKNSSVAR